MLRQVDIKEPVRLLAGTDARQSHLLNQAVLKRSQGPLDQAFGLRRVGVDELYPQLLSRSLKLRLGLFISQRVLNLTQD
jgi:hypothetical protein